MTLFEYLHQEFDILPLESDLAEIQRICNKDLEAELERVKGKKKYWEEKCQKQFDILDKVENNLLSEVSAREQAQAENERLWQFVGLFGLQVASGLININHESTIMDKAQELLKEKE